MDAIFKFLESVDYVANVDSPFSKTGKPTVTVIDHNTKMIENVTVSLQLVNVDFIKGGFIISSDVYILDDSLISLIGRYYTVDSIYVVDGEHYVTANLVARKK